MTMKNRIKTLAVALFTLAISSSLDAEVFTQTYETYPTHDDYELITDMLIGPGIARHPSGAKIQQTHPDQIGIYSNLVVNQEARVSSFTNGIVLSTGMVLR